MTEDKKLVQQEEIDDATLDDVTGGARTDGCTDPPTIPTFPNPFNPPPIKR